ncbi:O-methyltransferase [Flavihumibacter profundi]|jgi:hypothetical protein|uniref:hypothetical protein n=1 Tax=Flavihumibacter profundi TaxID=2716883 RepID=UPI001CC3D3A6|nr:hypothetical protein [Flavihumibacter profundi]MBZ5856617.1 hypothetical protein [Flavihumibacter profundi]
MVSDILTCSLLKTPTAAKAGSEFLELETGKGLSTSWIFDGMSPDSTLALVDNDSRFLAIAEKYLCNDQRLLLVEADLMDDMLPQPNWPEGQAEKARIPVAGLEEGMILSRPYLFGLKESSLP